MIAQHSQGPLFSPQLSFGHLGWAAFTLELYDKLFLFNDALCWDFNRFGQKLQTDGLFICIWVCRL